MANIGSLLKAEITRLCRRELRKELTTSRKASTTFRHHIAGLRRQVAELGKRSSMLAKQVAARAPDAAPKSTGKPVRFVSKGLRSLRARLGLSAAQLARLIGVSEQSVYNWETKKTTPRREQVAAIVALRSIGKREAHQRLDAARKPAPAAKRKKRK